MTYRSADTIHFDDLAKQITELKKEVNKREQEKKALADVVEQADLIEIKGVCCYFDRLAMNLMLYNNQADGLQSCPKYSSGPH